MTQNIFVYMDFQVAGNGRRERIVRLISTVWFVTDCTVFGKALRAMDRYNRLPWWMILAVRYAPKGWR